jgi:hypothetical protein
MVLFLGSLSRFNPAVDSLRCSEAEWAVMEAMCPYSFMVKQARGQQVGEYYR